MTDVNDGDTVYECFVCGWTGTSEEMDPIHEIASEMIEELYVMRYGQDPYQFRKCPECGDHDPEPKVETSGDGLLTDEYTISGDA